MSEPIKRLELIFKKGKKYLALLSGDFRPSRITIDRRFKQNKDEDRVTFWFWYEGQRHYRTVYTSVLELMVRHGRGRAKELRDIGKAGKKVPKRPKGYPPQ